MFLLLKCAFFCQLYKFFFFRQNMRNSEMCPYFSSPSTLEFAVTATGLTLVLTVRTTAIFSYFYDPNVKPVDKVILQKSRKHPLLSKLFAKLCHIQQKCYQELVSEKLVERWNIQYGLCFPWFFQMKLWIS